MKLPQLRKCVLKIIKRNVLMKKLLKQSELEIKIDKKETKELHKSKTY